MALNTETVPHDDGREQKLTKDFVALARDLMREVDSLFHRATLDRLVQDVEASSVAAAKKRDDVRQPKKREIHDRDKMGRFPRTRPRRQIEIDSAYRVANEIGGTDDVERENEH